MLLPMLAVAATLTPSDWVLYRGTAIVSRHPTQAACVEAAKALNVSRSYTCRTSTGVKVVVTVDTPPPPPPPPPPPATGGPTFSVSPLEYVGDGYSTVIWSGVAPCVASSDPAYAPWSGPKAANDGQSVSPDVTTVLTLSCANGTVSKTITVTGGVAPPPPPNPGTGGGGSTPPPVENLPPVTPLTTPIARTLDVAEAFDAALLDFAHTANREWNYGGHTVPADFPADQGNWDYNDASYAAFLFDRPSAWFKLYALLGNPDHLTYAIRDTKWYASQIDAGGYFLPKAKNGELDTKYGYVTPFLLYERATGSAEFRPVAQRVYNASVTGYSLGAPASAGLWTEREAGLHMEAALSWYQLTGDAAALNRAGAIVRQVGALAAANGGAPQVTYTQHEGGGPGGTLPTSLTNSPWMTALYFQAARTFYELTGDRAVLEQASAYFDWLDVNGLYDGGDFHPEFAGVTIPRYLTGPEIGDAFKGESDIAHCLDVTGLVSFAKYAKATLGLPTARVTQRETELKACTSRAFANWTRGTVTLPKYRIQSPRMFLWWVRGRYELVN